MTDMHDARREVALSLREIAACYLKFAQRGRQFDGLGGASATGGKIGKGSCRSRGSIQSAPVNRAQAAYEAWPPSWAAAGGSWCSNSSSPRVRNRRSAGGG
jgi:hypothetical protein